MKYEQAALDYSAITMEMLRTQGMDMKKVAGEVIAFAKRATLSKGNQCMLISPSLKPKMMQSIPR